MLSATSAQLRLDPLAFEHEVAFFIEPNQSIALMVVRSNARWAVDPGVRIDGEIAREFGQIAPIVGLHWWVKTRGSRAGAPVN